MAQFKNNPNLKLFYTDTDSIYTSLSPEQMNEQYPGIVSNSGLGKLKLEGIFKRAIFLAPKCYCLQDLDGKITYKVKGLMKNVPLTFKDFEALLLKDAFLDKSQTKWFKDLGKGVISVLEQSYTLRQTDNKRELILKNGKVIAIY
jgi:DNA polymerase elongation subunit (family B)